jgi:hypothetical protein
MKKSCILLLLGILAFSLIALTDDPFLVQLQAKLSRYYNKNIPLKLHVFLNQPAFASGDTLRYKTTLVADSDHGLIPDRQIVNIRLLDDKSNVVLDSKIVLNNGIGTGQLVLPGQMKAGYYSLIAFHPRMIENRSPQFFKLPVLIVGEKKIELKKTNDVQFFPEGGRLVPLVTNRIAISGPADSNIEIFKSDGKIVATAQCDTDGWGELFFKPVRGEDYRFTVNRGSQTRLPLAIRDGIGMLVTENASGNQFRVGLQIPDDVKDYQPYYVVLSQSENIIFGAELSFRKKASQLIVFPKDNLRGGVYAITVFNAKTESIAERLIFVEEEGPGLKVIIGKEEFRPREMIQLKLRLDQPTVAARVAVTVFQEDLFSVDSISVNSLRNYLGLNGNFPPNRWSGILPGTGKNRDLFLISQTDRLFKWDDVLNGTDFIQTPFEPFLRLSGKAQFRSGMPVPDSTFLQFFVQRNVSGYETLTGRDGRFTFPLLFDFFDQEEIIVWAEHNGTVLKDVVVIPDQQSVTTESYTFYEQSTSDLYWEFTRNQERVSLAYHQARPLVRDGATSLNKAVEDAVRGADIERRLSDYLLFPTMHETLLEIIPAVKSRAQKNIVRVWLDDEQREATADPLYIIDGVVTDNTSYFLSLNPAEVSTIKVINRHSKLSLIGSIARHGIILVDTKIANHSNKIPRASNVFRAMGLATQPVWKTSTFSTHPRVPDLRSTLYWNPDVTVTDGEVAISFPAADNTGRFRVQVDGITSEGIPVFAETNFSVSFLP